MTGEDHLPGRGENPKASYAIRQRRLLNENRFGQVELSCNSLHSCVIEAVRGRKNREGISLQRHTSEHVHNLIVIGASIWHGGQAAPYLTSSYGKLSTQYCLTLCQLTKL